VITHVVDIDPNINYILIHRRLLFCIQWPVNHLRYPSTMVALESRRGRLYLLSSYSEGSFDSPETLFPREFLFWPFFSLTPRHK